jgi:poly [ADP-ribose] polymerase
MSIKDYTVPGKKVAKLVCVTGDNNNKYYNLYEQNDGSFIAQYGRIQGTETIHPYRMNEWDKIYRDKTNPKKGYKDITHLFTEEITQDLKTADPVKTAAIQNAMVKQLMDDLQSFANKTIAANYTITQDNVTQKQVDEAQRIINEITSLMTGNPSTVTEINKHFLQLYTIIPRRMKNVRDYILSNLSGPSEVKFAHKLIENEQALLDTMAGQVEMLSKQKEANLKSIDPNEHAKTMDMLQMLGLEIQEVNSNEISMIKKMMDRNSNQFVKAFKVTNNKTEVKFKNNLDSAKNKSTNLYFHGSRNENFFNILQTGLLIRPSCAVSTGSMFGDGIYAARQCRKAIGYTSLSGSYWARGNANKAYIAIFEFHTGNQKHIHRHDSSCCSLSKSRISKDGFDSVFAHGGIDLINDEFIVYSPEQCTIRYLIEITK